MESGASNDVIAAPASREEPFVDSCLGAE